MKATEQILYTANEYSNNWNMSKYSSAGVAQIFKSDAVFCNISKIKQYFKSTANISCNLKWSLLDSPYSASSTIIASGTQSVSLTTTHAEKTFTPTSPIVLQPNRFYAFLWVTTDCEQVGQAYGNTVYVKDFGTAGNIYSDQTKLNIIYFGYVPRGTIYYNDTLFCPVCEECAVCETCTGSSTLVHFDFDNATTTDIGRIVATSKTYTDDTGTPTAITVSTYDVPIYLFYFIWIIMLTLVITILLFYFFKKNEKE